MAVPGAQRGGAAHLQQAREGAAVGSPQADAEPVGPASEAFDREAEAAVGGDADRPVLHRQGPARHVARRLAGDRRVFVVGDDRLRVEAVVRGSRVGRPRVWRGLLCLGRSRLRHQRRFGHGRRFIRGRWLLRDRRLLRDGRFGHLDDGDLFFRRRAVVERALQGDEKALAGAVGRPGRALPEGVHGSGGLASEQAVGRTGLVAEAVQRALHAPQLRPAAQHLGGAPRQALQRQAQRCRPVALHIAGGHPQGGGFEGCRQGDRRAEAAAVQFGGTVTDTDRGDRQLALDMAGDLHRLGTAAPARPVGDDHRRFHDFWRWRDDADQGDPGGIAALVDIVGFDDDHAARRLRLRHGDQGFEVAAVAVQLRLAAVDDDGGQRAARGDVAVDPAQVALRLHHLGVVVKARWRDLDAPQDQADRLALLFFLIQGEEDMRRLLARLGHFQAVLDAPGFAVVGDLLAVQVERSRSGRRGHPAAQHHPGLFALETALLDLQDRRRQVFHRCRRDAHQDALAGLHRGVALARRHGAQVDLALLHPRAGLRLELGRAALDVETVGRPLCLQGPLAGEGPEFLQQPTDELARVHRRLPGREVQQVAEERAQVVGVVLLGIELDDEGAAVGRAGDAVPLGPLRGGGGGRAKAQGGGETERGDAALRLNHDRTLLCKPKGDRFRRRTSDRFRSGAMASV